MFLKYITRKAHPRFIRTYFLFAVFILACGSTYLLDATAFWYPAYRLNAFVRFITGVISWITVFYLVKLLPVALTLKSHREWEIMISETGAQVQVQNLPVIEAIPFQMGQLFQNLVSNAIKFRNADKHPTVQISAEVMSAGELLFMMTMSKPTWITRDIGKGNASCGSLSQIMESDLMNLIKKKYSKYFNDYTAISFRRHGYWSGYL